MRSVESILARNHEGAMIIAGPVASRPDCKAGLIDRRARAYTDQAARTRARQFRSAVDNSRS